MLKKTLYFIRENPAGIVPRYLGKGIMACMKDQYERLPDGKNSLSNDHIREVIQRNALEAQARIRTPESLEDVIIRGIRT